MQTEKVEILWFEIVSHYREACIHYREGESDAMRILMRDELPNLISEWADITEMSTEECKLRVRAMISDEYRKITEAEKIQQIVIDHVAKHVLPKMTNYTNDLPYPTESNKAINEISNPAVKRESDSALPIDDDSRETNHMPLFTTRRKIPLHNIGDMIDALNAEEFEPMARSLSPLRAFT